VGFFADEDDGQQVSWVGISERDSFMGRMLAHVSLLVWPGEGRQSPENTKRTQAILIPTPIPMWGRLATTAVQISQDRRLRRRQAQQRPR